MPTQNVNDLSSQDQQKYFDDFEKWIEREFNSDESAAEELLKAGHPIYYRDPAYPGKTVREYPDGRRELVKTVIAEDNRSYTRIVLQEL